MFANELMQKVHEMKGYVEEIKGDRVDVIVDDSGVKTRLSMLIEPFREEGILGQGMLFRHVTYRKEDNTFYSKVFPDHSAKECSAPREVLEELDKLDIEDEVFRGEALRFAKGREKRNYGS